jgi:hypothetical protein
MSLCEHHWSAPCPHCLEAERDALRARVAELEYHSESCSAAFHEWMENGDDRPEPPCHCGLEAKRLAEALERARVAMALAHRYACAGDMTATVNHLSVGLDSLRRELLEAYPAVKP